MICNLCQKWPLIFLTLAMANPQIPNPYPLIPRRQMFPVIPPPMVPMPPPPPMPLSLPMVMRVDIVIPDDKHKEATTTEITTTTIKTIKDNYAVAIPMALPTAPPILQKMQGPLPVPIPMPMPPPIPMPAPSPVLFAVPGMMSSVCEKNRRNPKCPPCPPCTCSPCTPSFFSYCSLCHQKCRCRKPEDVPMIPPPKAPVPLPGPAFPMPYPNYIPYAVQGPAYVAFVPQIAPRVSEESSDSDSCENYHVRKSKIRKRIRQRAKSNRYGIYRRNNRRFDVEHNGNVIAKPVLTFLTSDGKVKMRKPLDHIDPSILMAG